MNLMPSIGLFLALEKVCRFHPNLLDSISEQPMSGHIFPNPCVVPPPCLMILTHGEIHVETVACRIKLHFLF